MLAVSLLEELTILIQSTDVNIIITILISFLNFIMIVCVHVCVFCCVHLYNLWYKWYIHLMAGVLPCQHIFLGFFFLSNSVFTCRESGMPSPSCALFIFSPPRLPCSHHLILLSFHGLIVLSCWSLFLELPPSEFSIVEFIFQELASGTERWLSGQSSCYPSVKTWVWVPIIHMKAKCTSTCL